MRTITVDKAQLLAKLGANRAAHAATFQLAIEKYREQAIEHFERYVKAIKAGGDVPRVLPLPQPEEHTEDYDRAIEMLKWHQGDTIQLDEGEFRQYVHDDWGWARSFLSNTTSYTNG